MQAMQVIVRTYIHKCQRAHAVLLLVMPRGTKTFICAYIGMENTEHVVYVKYVV